jgi:hypothetical protein
MVFKLEQKINEKSVMFRAQLFKNENLFTLWIIENENQIYTVKFLTILAADIYKLQDDCLTTVFLMRDDEEDFNVEIGKFHQNIDAMEFLKWLKNSMI